VLFIFRHKRRPSLSNFLCINNSRFLTYVCSFSGSSRMEEAADLYVRAANSFKMAKKWSG
jgi:hypothetical protein